MRQLNVNISNRAFEQFKAIAELRESQRVAMEVIILEAYNDMLREKATVSDWLEVEEANREVEYSGTAHHTGQSR